MSIPLLINAGVGDTHLAVRKSGSQCFLDRNAAFSWTQTCSHMT